jgi:alpha-amylase/alpha-mannosidase (GH57 family)
MISVLVIWHQHQPFYKDLISGDYRLPWTRLHGLKDYYGMVAMLEDVPDARVTINLVPSLVKQIQEYASGQARDPVMEVAFKPAESLTRDDRIFALTWLFQANYEHLIARYPRYKQLHGIFATAGGQPEKGLPLFSNQDFADLQILSQLSWVDEIYQQNDPVIRALVAKERGYVRDDQMALWNKQQELLGKILDAHRAAQDRGQVELTTSPFYHPILPLVCDTDSGSEAHPGGTLPRRFHHPDDARQHLDRAVKLHEQTFGQRPVGLWPSEGSVSDQALALAAEAGFRWAATDEGVLGRSLRLGFARDPHGVPENAAWLYASYDLTTPTGPLRLFFRDHQFSDLVGFVYSKMDPQDAARDIVSRIERATSGISAGAEDVLVPIILDGENAWEYYPESGREFLRCFYRAVTRHPKMRMVTGSQAAAAPARRTLTHVVPGSWINANFDIWIGAPDDHRAWNLLSDARDFYESRVTDVREGRREITAAQRELAMEELMIAEGSDWCWWYGPEHHSHNDADFDRLYRSHLSNVYRALGEPAPLELAAPLTRQVERVFHAPPRSAISPVVDGRVTTYFEWLGAGLYSPDQHTSSMHGRRFYFDQLHYGCDDDNFYLRLDFLPDTLTALGKTNSEVHVRMGGGQAQPVELVAHLQQGARKHGIVDVCVGRIFEMRVSLASVGLRGAVHVTFQVVLVEDGLPVDMAPSEGWLTLETSRPPGE